MSHLERQLGERPPGEEHERLFARPLDAAHEGSPWDSSGEPLSSVERRVTVGRPPELAPRGRTSSRTGGRRPWPLLFDPALDVALAATANGERPGRDVLDDHRPGRGVGAVAHGHRRDQHRVAADPHVVADDRRVLGLPVVVGEDRGRADVRCAPRSSRPLHKRGAEPSNPHRPPRSSSRRSRRPWPRAQAGCPGAGRYRAQPSRAARSRRPRRWRRAPPRRRRRSCRAASSSARPARRVAIVVRPSNIVFGSTTASGSRTTSTSIQVVAGSITVTPSRMKCGERADRAGERAPARVARGR